MRQTAPITASAATIHITAITSEQRSFSTLPPAQVSSISPGGVNQRQGSRNGNESLDHLRTQRYH
jgi:hypothetical protein